VLSDAHTALEKDQKQRDEKVAKLAAEQAEEEARMKAEAAKKIEERAEQLVREQEERKEKERLKKEKEEAKAISDQQKEYAQKIDEQLRTLESKNILRIPYEDLKGGFSNETHVGGGNFSDVFKMKWNSLEVAVKLIKQNLAPEAHISEAKDFKEEVLIMRKLKHENIIKFIGYCEGNPSIPGAFGVSKRLSIVTEYIKGSPLTNIITNKEARQQTNISENNLRLTILLQIVNGMQYIHTLACGAHRDLKAENIMVSSDLKVKLLDFGVSKLWQATTRGLSIPTANTISSVGTPTYMAPEVITFWRGYDKPTQDDWKRADVYSFGILLYELLTWQRAWKDQVLNEINRLVLNGERPLLSDEAFEHSELCELTQDCWTTEPSKRPSFKDIFATVLMILAKAKPV